MKYSIEKVTTLIGARRIGEADAQIGWLLTDSRSLCFPEETLFFALRSSRNDGHRYISDLYRRGVRNFVVEAKGILETQTNSLENMADANFLIVPSPLAALQRLAERHLTSLMCPSLASQVLMVRRWLRSGSTNCCSLHRKSFVHLAVITPRLACPFLFGC